MFEYTATPEMVEAVIDFNGLHPDDIDPRTIGHAVDMAVEDEGNWCSTPASKKLVALAREQYQAYLADETTELPTI